jgi:CubicO group peptidase (beta-lactamase class C family)
MRWRLRHGHEHQATAVLRPAASPTQLPKRTPISLDAVRFNWPAGTEISFDEYRKASVLDGFMVLRDGGVVFEAYYDGFGPESFHNWASMSKSIVGVLALRLAREGAIKLTEPVSRHVPELASTPFGAATVQQNLDMQVSVAYPKDLPPDLGLFAAAGLAPLRPGAPANIHDFLRAVMVGSEPHGSRFYYQNGSTEAVAWALERASGRALPDLIAEYVWTPMGASDNGYYLLDRQGTAFAAGGVWSTLGDLARFGEFVRTGLNAQGDAAMARRLLSADGAKTAPGRDLRYRDFWWHGERGPIALGRFGQRLAIVPEKGLVIAQFGAYEDERPRATTTEEAAKPKAADLRDGEAFEALALAIAERL